MKAFVITVAVVCLTVTAGIIVYLDHQKAAATPVVEAPAKPVEAATTDVTTTKTESSVPLASNSNPPPQTVMVAAAAPEAKPDDSANPIHKAVDDLLHAKSAKEKHELFQALLKSGQLDQAIAELKQRATDNPTDAEIPTTLGEALLNKVRDMHDSGSGDYNEIGILAMQADQSFNAALKIDPSNWEAQFVKASSMYYWPADPARDNDVVQRLTGLVDQQETMATQPQFAQTYTLLGNEYQKIGQPDKAMATWQLGLQKYPGDATLQKKVSGQ
ncbi:MAG TPA: hypothetical protein VGO57_02925 [Verrucomicrobiae bacterium]|jgi:tetratricopeptide (TPR) repeat protein